MPIAETTNRGPSSRLRQRAEACATDQQNAGPEQGGSARRVHFADERLPTAATQRRWVRALSNDVANAIPHPSAADLHRVATHQRASTLSKLAGFAAAMAAMAAAVKLTDSQAIQPDLYIDPDRVNLPPAWLKKTLLFTNGAYAGDAVDAQGICNKYGGVEGGNVGARPCTTTYKMYVQPSEASTRYEDAIPNGHPKDIKEKFSNDANMALAVASALGLTTVVAQAVSTFTNSDFFAANRTSKNAIKAHNRRLEVAHFACHLAAAVPENRRVELLNAMILGMQDRYSDFSQFLINIIENPKLLREGKTDTALPIPKKVQEILAGCENYRPEKIISIMEKVIKKSKNGLAEI
jgi:hypothetical protein